MPFLCISVLKHLCRPVWSSCVVSVGEIRLLGVPDGVCFFRVVDASPLRKLSVVMSEELLWSAYLDQLIQGLSSKQKKQLDQIATRQTFSRWRAGQSIPDSPLRITTLLNLLPVSQEQRNELRRLMQNDERIRKLLSSSRTESSDADGTKSSQEEMSFLSTPPADLYALVLLIGRETSDPEHASWWQCSEILKNVLHQMTLARADLQVEVMVAKCMPPREGSVRSVRADFSISTQHTIVSKNRRLFGSESLVGWAVSSRQAVVIKDTLESRDPVPLYQVDEARLMAVFPLKREGRIAGAMAVTVSNALAFEQDYLDLLQKYADLISSTCREGEFIDSERIALAVMPPWNIQSPVWTAFPAYLAEEQRNALHSATSPLDVNDCEQIVLRNIESQFLNSHMPPSSSANTHYTAHGA